MNGTWHSLSDSPSLMHGTCVHIEWKLASHMGDLFLQAFHLDLHCEMRPSICIIPRCGHGTRADTGEPGTPDIGMGARYSCWLSKTRNPRSQVQDIKYTCAFLLPTHAHGPKNRETALHMESVSTQGARPHQHGGCTSRVDGLSLSRHGIWPPEEWAWQSTRGIAIFKVERVPKHAARP